MEILNPHAWMLKPQVLETSSKAMNIVAPTYRYTCTYHGLGFRVYGLGFRQVQHLKLTARRTLKTIVFGEGNPNKFAIRAQDPKP